MVGSRSKLRLQGEKWKRSPTGGCAARALASAGAEIAEELLHPLDELAGIGDGLLGTCRVDAEGALVVGLFAERLKGRVAPVGVRGQLASAGEVDAKKVGDSLVSPRRLSRSPAESPGEVKDGVIRSEGRAVEQIGREQLLGLRQRGVAAGQLVRSSSAALPRSCSAVMPGSPRARRRRRRAARARPSRCSGWGRRGGRRGAGRSRRRRRRRGRSPRANPSWSSP